MAIAITLGHAAPPGKKATGGSQLIFGQGLSEMVSIVCLRYHFNLLLEDGEQIDQCIHLLEGELAEFGPGPTFRKPAEVVVTILLDDQAPIFARSRDVDPGLAEDHRLTMHDVRASFPACHR
jgi:hypothetical protein